MSRPRCDLLPPAAARSIVSGDRTRPGRSSGAQRAEIRARKASLVNVTEEIETIRIKMAVFWEFGLVDPYLSDVK